jgi:hypothetical protein
MSKNLIRGVLNHDFIKIYKIAKIWNNPVNLNNLVKIKVQDYLICT